MAASGAGSGTGNRDTLNRPESISPHSSMKTSTGDIIAKIDQQINVLKEGAKSEGSSSDRSEQREATKPQVICHRYPFGPDDFVNDEMSVLGSIDFVALGRIRDHNRGPDSGSASKRWRSQHHGRWSGQQHFRSWNDSYPAHGRGGQNGGYCAYPEHGSYPPHHGVHDRPDWHFRGGQGDSFGRPCSQGSATRQGQDFHMEYNPNPVGGAQRPLSPPTNLGVQPVSIGRKKPKMKSRKRQKLALKAAAKAQANQNQHAVVTVKNTADSTTWRASNTGAEGQNNAGKMPPPPPDSTQRKQDDFEKAPVKVRAQRMAFVCPVCKFRSFYKKNLDAHLASKFHKDHFKFLSERLSQPTVDFLQRGFSKKYEHIEDFISQIPNHREAVCRVYEEQDLTRDLNMGHFMRRAEAAHCLACNVYVPMDVRVIQKHLRSLDHKHYCQVMMEHSKTLGLSVAQRILKTKVMHRALKRYLQKCGVTDVPEMNPEKASPTGQRGVPDAEDDVIRQETEQEAEGDGNDEEAEPFSEQDAEAEVVGHDKEVELFCEQMIQDAEAEGDGSDEEAEVEPFCEQDTEAEGDGNDQEAEPLSEGVVPAAEQMSSEAVQEEAEEHDQTESLFDLLDEEDDMEGVELGEEELEEDDDV